MNTQAELSGIKRPFTKRIYIAVASCRDWKPDFAVCLMSLTNTLNSLGFQYEVATKFQASLLPAARTQFIEQAIASGSDYLLMIDDDMAFGPLSVLRLIESMEEIVNSGRPVVMVAANYVTKRSGSAPTAKMYDGADHWSTRTDQRLTEVESCGLGLALANMRAIIESMPRPWFEVSYSDQHNNHLGEDRYFCKLAHHAFGGQSVIFIDNFASRAVGHIGDYLYTEQTIEAATQQGRISSALFNT